MDRIGLAALACVLVAIPVGLGACGDDDDGASETLPPIATTTSSTVLLTTTTTWVPTTYEIVPGDGLAGIAERFGVDIDTLAILNGIVDHDDIEAGDVLDIPPPTTTSSIAPPTGT